MPELLRDHTELLENYQSAASVVTEYNNSLREIGMLVYSPYIREQIQSLVSEISGKVNNLHALAETVTSLIEYNADKLSKEQYEALAMVAEFILGDELPTTLISALNDNMLKTLKELAELQGKLEAEQSELFAQYNEHILDVNYTALRQRWMEAEQKWFLAKYLDRRAVVNTLSSYSKNRGRVNDNEVMALCDRISAIRKVQGEVNDLIDYLGSTYNIKRELKNLNASTIQLYYERLVKL